MMPARFGNGGGWWHSGKDCPPLPFPVGVKGMPPFPLQLPRTMALGSRPGPGPGGASCTGAQRFIQILGRLMPRFSHARQACQVCQCSQSPRWPSTTSCSGCRETRDADAGAVVVIAAWRTKLRRTSGDLKDLDKVGIDLETSLAAITLAPLPVDSVVTVLRGRPGGERA